MLCAGDASVWVGTEGPRALPARGVLPAVPGPRLSPARSVLCGTAAPLPRAGHSPDGTLGSGVCRQACQGLTPKPHAPFDGVGPTSPNLKRHPGLSVRPGSVEPRWPRTPCAGCSRRRRGSACRGSGLPFGSRRSHPRVAGTPRSPRSPPPGLLRAVGSRRDPAGGARCGPAPAGRCKRERKKPRPCKNAARSFLVLVLLPARMRAGHRLPLSIPSINPAAQLPRAELRLAGQRLRQSPVSKTGSSSGRGGCAPPVAPGGQTGTAKPRAALPRRAQGSAGLLPLGQPGWAVPASSVGCGTLPTCPRQCPPPGAGSGWGIQELSLDSLPLPRPARRGGEGALPGLRVPENLPSRDTGDAGRGNCYSPRLRGETCSAQQRKALNYRSLFKSCNFQVAV